MPGIRERAEVAEIPAPLTPRDALRFGLGHALAILDQAARGLPRTLPFWLAARALVPLPRRRRALGVRHRDATPHPLSNPVASVLGMARDALAMQVLWSVAYAAVSGARTASRLARFDRERVLPLEIRAPGDEVLSRASAYRAPMGTAWHIEGVFAWPRHAGGGSAVLKRILEDADIGGHALVLTALSPRLGRAYEQAGFRKIVWTYWMRREPRTPERRRADQGFSSSRGASRHANNVRSSWSQPESPRENED